MMKKVCFVRENSFFILFFIYLLICLINVKNNTNKPFRHTALIFIEECVLMRSTINQINILITKI